jgi:hypothetical protein
MKEDTNIYTKEQNIIENLKGIVSFILLALFMSVVISYAYPREEVPEQTKKIIVEDRNDMEDIKNSEIYQKSQELIEWQEKMKH